MGPAELTLELRQRGTIDSDTMLEDRHLAVEARNKESVSQHIQLTTRPKGERRVFERCEDCRFIKRRWIDSHSPIVSAV